MIKQRSAAIQKEAIRGVEGAKWIAIVNREVNRATCLPSFLLQNADVTIYSWKLSQQGFHLLRLSKFIIFGRKKDPKKRRLCFVRKDFAAR